MMRFLKIEIRITSAERAFWRKMASAYGMSVSQYIRSKLPRPPDVESNGKDDVEEEERPPAPAAPREEVKKVPVSKLPVSSTKIGGDVEYKDLCDRCKRIGAPACYTCKVKNAKSAPVPIRSTGPLSGGGDSAGGASGPDGARHSTKAAEGAASGELPSVHEGAQSARGGVLASPGEVARAPGEADRGEEESGPGDR